MPAAGIEIICPRPAAASPRMALFDFDGTLSLIREGWQGVMMPMMVELLRQTPRAEREAKLRAVVAEFVDRLTGKQTIYQMIQLCHEIEQRGGQAKDPLIYKRMYLDRLWKRIESRLVALKTGQIPPERLMVPGAAAMLKTLRRRGVTCYLASGTDEADVRAEAVALGLAPSFAGIYGAQDNYQTFSKRMVIARIIAENNLAGEQLVAFGDGYVEIEETKAAGGIAVGIASNEADPGRIDRRKRRRLIAAGADIIAPDFTSHRQLAACLLGGEN
ncbi:MAG: HAD family hydrolase [Anaerolineae bacterium]